MKKQTIGGQFFGGAADACITWKSGELQQQLAAAGISFEQATRTMPGGSTSASPTAC